MAPLVPLQKKVYVSILRKELPKLLALASGASNAQSLHNVVSISLPIQAYLFSIFGALCSHIHATILSHAKFSTSFSGNSAAENM